MSKLPSEVTINVTKDDNGKWYAWVKELGLTVSGATKEEAFDEMDKTLRYVYEEEGLIPA